MRRQARVTCIIGTRPEAIKMAPVVWELRRREWAAVRILATAQHRHLVDPLLRLFAIDVDRDLDVMSEGQTLTTLTCRLLERLSQVLVADNPDVVVAQGDTTTVMTAAMACFYAGIPFAHVEAGLRTGNLQQPFPEEFNRIVASRVASLNFAPTEIARDNLLREGVDPATVFVTGNTVIDTLKWTMAHAPARGIELAPSQRLLLVTLHRRESFGDTLSHIFSALRRLIEDNPDLVILYPVHPNPNVNGPARALLAGINRLHLCEPLDYPAMIGAMQQAQLILTDSGGIQEEASALATPVLVARDATERPEGVSVGAARLVGTDAERIRREVQKMLDGDLLRGPHKATASPYGDGHAGERIGDIIEAEMAKRRG